MGTIKMKGLLRGLRYISIIFDEEKEPEMEIGFPTDVRHVAHIGWDGPSVDSPSWLTNFERPNGGFQSAPLPITSGEPHESPEVRWVSEDATNPGREPINSSGKCNSDSKSDRRRGSGENSESGNHRRRSAEHSESTGRRRSSENSESRKGGGGGGGRRHPKDSSSSSSSSNNRQIQERSLDGGGGSESNSGNLPDVRRSKKKIRRKKSKEVSNNESGTIPTTRSSKLRNSNNNTPDASPSRFAASPSRFAYEVANDESPSTRSGLTSSKETVPSNLSDPELDSDDETETGSVAASERQ